MIMSTVKISAATALEFTLDGENYVASFTAASDGHKLTQADTSISADKRTLASKIFLAINDSADNWTEITDEEAETIKTQAGDTSDEGNL